MQNTTNQPMPATTTADGADHIADERQRARVSAQIAKRSFATMATTSPAGRPHAAGVIYEAVGENLWIHTLRSSRKARNIAASGHVGITIPFRKLPVGPPSTIQFQAEAEIVDMQAPEVTELLASGKLRSIAGHGALEMADGCFVRIAPPRTVHSFGLGAKIIDLIRDPLNSGARTVRFDR